MITLEKTILKSNFMIGTNKLCKKKNTLLIALQNYLDDNIVIILFLKREFQN